jgi:hypothetical protein
LFFQVERSIFLDGHFTIHIVDVLQLRADVLDHVEGLTAAGTCAADENNGLVRGQAFDFGFQIVDGYVDGVFRLPFWNSSASRTSTR